MNSFQYELIFEPVLELAYAEVRLTLDTVVSDV